MIAASQHPGAGRTQWATLASRIIAQAISSVRRTSPVLRAPLAVKSKRRRSGATRDPRWSASPSTPRRAKFRMCVAVWLLMMGRRRAWSVKQKTKGHGCRGWRSTNRTGKSSPYSNSRLCNCVHLRTPLPRLCAWWWCLPLSGFRTRSPRAGRSLPGPACSSPWTPSSGDTGADQHC